MRHLQCVIMFAGLTILSGCNETHDAADTEVMQGEAVVCAADFQGVRAISLSSGKEQILVAPNLKEFPSSASVYSSSRKRLYYYDSAATAIIKIDAIGRRPAIVYKVPQEFLETFTTATKSNVSKSFLTTDSLKWLQVDDSGDHLYFVLSPRNADDQLVQLDLNTGKTRVILEMIVERQERAQWRDANHLLMGVGLPRKLASICIDDDSTYQLLPLRPTIQVSANRKTFIDWEGGKNDDFIVYDSDSLKPLSTVSTKSLPGHTTGVFGLVGERQLLVTRMLGESPGFLLGTYVLDMDTMKYRKLTLSTFDQIQYVDLKR